MAEVVQIQNLKAMQQRGAMVMRDHQLRMLAIRPDSQRTTYGPNDEFVITLHGHEVDYINLDTSILMFKIRLYDPNDFAAAYVKKTLVGGSVALIHTLENWCGTTQLEMLEYYNIDIHSEMLIHLGANYKNDFTLMNCSKYDNIYKNYLHVHEADHYSKAVWVQVPLITCYGPAGFIPTYQLSNKIALHFRLSAADEVFRCECSCPPDFQGLDTSAGTFCSDTFRELAVEKYPNSATTYSYRVDDIVLLAHGLTVLSGGKLDAMPFEIWTESRVVVRQPSLGTTFERFTFQVKKSSIETAKFLFIAPEAFTAQLMTSPDIGQWFRATTFNQTDATATYKPWIDWYEISLGGTVYPTPTGAGRRSPPDIDENCLLWYGEFCRYADRKSIAGDSFDGCLKPHDESGHGYIQGFVPKQPNLILGGQTGAAAASFWDPHQWKTVDDSYKGCTYENPIVRTPSWQQNGLFLYSGTVLRFGLVGSCSTTVGDFLQARFARRVPGAQFMILQRFGVIDKAKLIQGIDTELFNIQLNITRNSAIAPATACVYGIGPESYKVAGLLAGAGTDYGTLPDVFGFLTFDIKLTIFNGIIAIDD